MNPDHETCLQDVHQLRVFLAVADNLSFTRAAERLFLTQSAVSHQIARLERSLGAALLLRNGKTISVTRAGEVLVQHARRVFAALEHAEAAVKAVANPDAGHLRIGTSATACQYIIPEALREFRECFPAWSLTITPGDTPLVSQALIDGDIDLGLLIRADRRDKFQYSNLFTDELGFLLSPLHPWAKAGKVDRRTLSDQRLVLYSRNSATFRMIERYFLREQARLRDWIELGSIEPIKEIVKLGLGVSMLARWVALPELKEKSLVWLPVPGAKLKRNWCIAATPGRVLSLPEQTFIGLCQSVAAQLPLE